MPVPSSTLTRPRVAWLTLLAVVSCGGLRASTVPLGGSRELEAPGPTRAGAVASAVPAVAEKEDEGSDEAAEEQADEAPVVASSPLPTADETASSPGKVVAGAFQPKPYVAGQKWTRLFDLTGELKSETDAAMVMSVASHQEARFEVLTASAGAIEKLRIEYVTYTSKMTLMGSTQESTEDVSGKTYLITFPQGKPDVKTSGGAAPTKKELETVNDDAREPLEAAKALKELAQLAAKGGGDFTGPGAVALAGGEDDDTKVSGARASLRRANAGKSAELDLAYTLTNTADQDTVIEMKLAGTVLVLDAPGRYQSFTLAGPLELRSSDGMGGRGTTKLVVSYRY